MTTSRERVAKHRKAKRDAGLARLPETWVPAELLPHIMATIRVEMEIETARRANAEREAKFTSGMTEQQRKVYECNKMSQAEWARNHPGGF